VETWARRRGARREKAGGFFGEKPNGKYHSLLSETVGSGLLLAICSEPLSQTKMCTVLLGSNIDYHLNLSESIRLLLVIYIAQGQILGYCASHAHYHPCVAFVFCPRTPPPLSPLLSPPFLLTITQRRQRWPHPFAKRSPSASFKPSAR